MRAGGTKNSAGGRSRDGMIEGGGSLELNGWKGKNCKGGPTELSSERKPYACRSARPLMVLGMVAGCGGLRGPLGGVESWVWAVAERGRAAGVTKDRVALAGFESRSQKR